MGMDNENDRFLKLQYGILSVMICGFIIGIGATVYSIHKGNITINSATSAILITLGSIMLVLIAAEYYNIISHKRFKTLLKNMKEKNEKD